MEGNDLGETLIGRIAVMFEGLVEVVYEPTEQIKTGLFRRKVVDIADLTLDQQARRWRPREMPLKSLTHLVNHLNHNVEVWTYMPPEYTEIIENWLLRKGVVVAVYSYDGLDALLDDVRYNRELQTLYTPFAEDAAWIGPRATVMSPDSTWGI